MRSINYICIFIFAVIILLSCKKENDSVDVVEPKNYNLAGKIQKGPFITGSEIHIYELSNQIVQTGKSYLATINADDGSFSLNNVLFSSNLLLLNASGFYFNELLGSISSTRISLQSIVNLNENTKVNVNLLTHISVKRIEKLVGEGQTFSSAASQSRNELLSFLGVTDNFSSSFDDCDISQIDDFNGVLLAFSVIFQRYDSNSSNEPSLTAEMSELIARFSTDFSDNGKIDNQSIINTLIYNTSLLNIADIRNNVINRYSNIGILVNVPNFWKYINAFVKKYDGVVYNEILYPSSAPDYPHRNNSFINVLYSSDTAFSLSNSYCVAAIVPIGRSLTVKIKNDNSNACIFNAGSPSSGWVIDRNHYDEGYEVYSHQRENSLITVPFGFYVSGSATIEYYENGSVLPTKTKRIYFQ